MKNKNTNVVNSLAGKVPGVNVTQFSGSAGAGASITIRGGNSTSDSRQNQPLFVIDGIIYDNSTTLPVIRVPMVCLAVIQLTQIVSWILTRKISKACRF